MTEDQKKIEAVEEKMRKLYEEKEAVAKESYQKTLYEAPAPLTDDELLRKRKMQAENSRLALQRRAAEDRKNWEENQKKEKRTLHTLKAEIEKVTMKAPTPEDAASEEEFWRLYREERKRQNP